MTESAMHVRVIEETSAYWRVVFGLPAFQHRRAPAYSRSPTGSARANGRQLEPAGRRIRKRGDPEFYPFAHFDLTGKIGNIMTAVGDFGPPDPDAIRSVRLTKVPGGQHREDPRLRPGREQRSSSSPATCASHRAKIRDSANPKSEWDCIPVAAVRNVFHIWSVGVGHSKSFLARTISTATPSTGGTIRIRQPSASARGAGRLRRRTRAPDRLLRPACHRRREESRQPGLVAVRRPAPRRHHLV